MPPDTRTRRPPPDPLVGPDDVARARERLVGRCLVTPVLPVPDGHGGELHVKAESLQPTGSFKIRGATNAVALLDDDQRARGVVTFSAGNHGLALARAARAAGTTATVVVPDTASPAKVHLLAAAADVMVRPPDEIVGHAHDLARDRGLALVHPFDDVAVIAGQGTVGAEIVEQVDRPEVVLVPVGGGGLVAGVAVAVKAAVPGVRVVAVEPELAADLAEGLTAGRRVTWTRAQTARTIADGLRSPAVGTSNWEFITQHVDDVVTVSEEAIRRAMRHLAEHAHLVVEPSGAVATAAALQHGRTLGTGGTVAVASGGNVDLGVFAAAITPPEPGRTE